MVFGRKLECPVRERSSMESSPNAPSDRVFSLEGDFEMPDSPSDFEPDLGSDMRGSHLVAQDCKHYDIRRRRATLHSCKACGQNGLGDGDGSLRDDNWRATMSSTRTLSILKISTYTEMCRHVIAPANTIC